MISKIYLDSLSTFFNKDNDLSVYYENAKSLSLNNIAYLRNGCNIKDKALHNFTPSQLGKVLGVFNFKYYDYSCWHLDLEELSIFILSEENHGTTIELSVKAGESEILAYDSFIKFYKELDAVYKSINYQQ